jgi:histidinol-phosphate aminotransferase
MQDRRHRFVSRPRGISVTPDRFSRRGFVHLLGAGAAGALLAPAATARGLEARFDPERARDERHRAPVLVRIDSNENPRGPGRAALDAIGSATAMVHRYPDDMAAELRGFLAQAYGAGLPQVCLGCGSTDVLRAAVQAFTGPSRALVTAAPTYEAAVAEAKRVGAPVREVPVGKGLELDLAAMRAAATGAGLVYLCNPNNPTGTVHGREVMQDFIAAVRRENPECAILVDEAYHEYVADRGYGSMTSVALATPKVLVARTFSKVYGMAGLRAGYGVGHESTIEAVAPWTLDIGVNTMAAMAALASIAAPGAADHLARERRLNAEARELTVRYFTDAGYVPAAAEANFVMVDVRRDVRAFRQACRAQGIAIGRPFPPLATHARVSIGTREEMEQAIAVFRRVLTTS